MLETNQYPPAFYDSIIKRTLDKIVLNQKEEENIDEEEETDEKKLIFVQYRGKPTEKFEQTLRRIDAPCKVISTIKKLKTTLPSLKSPIEKSLKSRVVYQINCPRCYACYVGQTSRHLATRMKEHQRSGPKDKTSSPEKGKNFAERLKSYCGDVYPADHSQRLGEMYYLEDNWFDLIGDSCMTNRMRGQQQGVWEFLTTERNYIRRMRVICEVFQQVLKIAQRENDLVDISADEIFGNIDDILITNDQIWKDYYVNVINRTRREKRPIKPSELLSNFHKTDELYKAYTEFTLKHERCSQMIREYAAPYGDGKKTDFRIYLEFCENLPQCERLKLSDLMIEPVQRITRYSILLTAINKKTENVKEKKNLETMVEKCKGFTSYIDKRKHLMEENEKLEICLNQFEYYNTWLAGNEDVTWIAVDFLRVNIPDIVADEQRCILKQETMTMIENKKTGLVVEVLLFTDVLVLSRRRNSTKKLVIVKQLFFLDKIRFIKSEISNTSIVFLYLDDHGLLASSLMLELNERSREKWLLCLDLAKERYEKALSGEGSTLIFLQDDKNCFSNDRTEVAKLPFGEVIRNFSGRGSFHGIKSQESCKSKGSIKRSCSDKGSRSKIVGDPDKIEQNNNEISQGNVNRVIVKRSSSDKELNFGKDIEQNNNEVSQRSAKRGIIKRSSSKELKDGKDIEQNDNKILQGGDVKQSSSKENKCEKNEFENKQQNEESMLPRKVGIVRRSSSKEISEEELSHRVSKNDSEPSGSHRHRSASWLLTNEKNERGGPSIRKLLREDLWKRDTGSGKPTVRRSHSEVSFDENCETKSLTSESIDSASVISESELSETNSAIVDIYECNTDTTNTSF